MISQIEQRKIAGEELIKSLQKYSGVVGADLEREFQIDITKKILSVLDEFDKESLPYAAITVFVYGIEINDPLNFISKLERDLFEIVKEGETLYIKCIKLLEHLELAQQQKDSLFEKQRVEIETIKDLHKELSAKTEKVDELSRQVTNLIDKNEKLEKSNQKLEESNKSMITNFISILGIFAAILMGTFGAIQGFGSLFNNADDLSIGKLFIISSLGASSVVLILFLLLNGVSKLTNRSLSSSLNEHDPLIKRHPTLVMVYCILVFVTLIGASLELSNVDIQFAWQGIWWAFPTVWIAYFIRAFVVKDLFFIFKWFK
jgi:FtsZ-binding cell division protein ZapB